MSNFGDQQDYRRGVYAYWPFYKFETLWAIKNSQFIFVSYTNIVYIDFARINYKLTLTQIKLNLKNSSLRNKMPQFVNCLNNRFM